MIKEHYTATKYQISWNLPQKMENLGSFFRIWGGRCDMRHSISDFGTYFSQSARLHAPRQICVFRNALQVTFCKFWATVPNFGLCAHFGTHLGLVRAEFGTHLGLLSSVGSNQFSTFFGTNFSLTRSTNRLILSRLLLSSLCPSLQHRSPAPRRIDRLNQPMLYWLSISTTCHAIRIRRHAPCSLLMIE